MRDSYWDNIKGIAIIAVVFIHSINSNLELNSFNQQFAIISRQFIDFPVALFIFMAGFFAYRKEQVSVSVFYTKRLYRLLVPYIFWSLLYLLIEGLRTDLSPVKSILRICIGTAMPIGYFVVVLAQLILLTPLIARVRDTKTHVLVSILSFIVAMLCFYYFQVININTPLSKFPYYALPFFMWLPFYQVGYCLAKFPISLERFIPWLLIICGFALNLSVLEGFVWASKPELAVSQLKATTVFYSFMVCVIAYVGRNFSTGSEAAGVSLLAR